MKYGVIITILLQCCLALKANSTILHRYESIFNFGDSLSDTGNYLLSAGEHSILPNFPYGKTFFGHPTGRYSDGRLIIDFFAEAFGLAYLKPYLEVVNGSVDARRGVNFAVAGATALDPTFFAARHIPMFTMTNYSLSVQLQWFKKLKSSLCTTQQDCDTYFKKSLFLVGEIGGNDYNLAFALGASFEQLRPIVPIVVEAITNATSMLIEEGAVELVVPGNFPMGCSPSNFASYPSSNKSDYDSTTGCLKVYNEFAVYHNDYLWRELQILRQKYGHARIIYADYYRAAMRLFRAPKDYGFYGGTQAACCGSGGPHNFNVSTLCGSKGTTVCADPSAVVSWDGIHLTETAYRHIAKGLLNGPFTSPRLISSMYVATFLEVNHQEKTNGFLGGHKAVEWTGRVGFASDKKWSDQN